MVVLAVRSVFLDGGEEGLKFYLSPNLDAIRSMGLQTVLFAAMGQAFFTLSIGMGSIAIFGSYIDKSRSLTGEALCITLLDTSVALMAGLIIFPSCFAYGVNPTAGPPLIFITLPRCSTPCPADGCGARCFSCSCASRPFPLSSPCLRTSSPMAWT